MDNCRVCGQPRQIMGVDTHTPQGPNHVFSEDGRLVSWADQAKSQRAPAGRLSIDSFGPTSRLLEVLLERGLITPEDALYITVGQRTRTSPKMPEPDAETKPGEPPC